MVTSSGLRSLELFNTFEVRSGTSVLQEMTEKQLTDPSSAIPDHLV